MTNSVLIIAAHPDDEVLGCGGTIAKLVNQGSTVHVAFLSDGVTSRDNSSYTDNNLIELRRIASRKSCEILGIKSIYFEDFDDNRLDTVALLDLIKPIERLIEKYRPTTVFTHHAGDLNIDHRRVHEAVTTACRPQGKFMVKNLLCFEVPSSTEWNFPGSASAFIPNWFVDISDTINLKLSALNAYVHELREWPHPRSIQGVKHLAGWRGATIGVDAAEAFVLGRNIV